MTRPQIKAAIKEDIKHVIDKLYGVEPQDVPHEILNREAKLVINDVLVLSKEDESKISYRDESSDDVHITSVDTGRIRILL